MFSPKMSLKRHNKRIALIKQILNCLCKDKQDWMEANRAYWNNASER